MDTVFSSQTKFTYNHSLIIKTPTEVGGDFRVEMREV